jgi:hypothetical protein
MPNDVSEMFAASFRPKPVETDYAIKSIEGEIPLEQPQAAPRLGRVPDRTGVGAFLDHARPLGRFGEPEGDCVVQRMSRRRDL